MKDRGNFKVSPGWIPTKLYLEVCARNPEVRCPNCGQKARNDELERVMNHTYCRGCKG